MDKNQQKNILKRFIEAVTAIALVLLFFVILILVFNAVFPEGSGLRFIFQERTEDRAQARRHESTLRLSQGDSADLLFGDDNWAATLMQTRNSVKSKKAGDIAWKSARKGMRLGNLDAVQTLENSSAVIKFDAQNFIDLGQNSLIVIRRLEKDLLFKEKRSFMVVVDGELRGRIAGDDESDVYLEIETPNAIARLNSNPGDRDGIEFKIDVLDDANSAVTIFAGEGEVEAQGELVRLGKNQLTRIEGALAPTQPVTLPDPAPMLTPEQQRAFFYRSLPPRVKIAWKKLPGVQQYHLVLAEDADFTRVLIDKKTSQDEFTHGNLRQGSYFWKVSSISSAGEGPFGPVRQFSLHQDQTPPKLEVQFPPEKVDQADIAVTGKSEPDVAIFILGDMVPVENDGSFHHNLQLKQGINVVVVEAIDPAGNVNYQSQLINRKY